MNILFLTYGLPFPPDRGARIRDFHFVKNVSRKHNVLLLSMLDPTGQTADISELSSYCSWIDYVEVPRRSALNHLQALFDNLINGRPIAVHDYYQRALAEKLSEVVTTQHIDIIQIEHSFMAPYIHALPEKRTFKTVLDFHNIGFVQYPRMVGLSTGLYEKSGFVLKSLLMRNWERRYARFFDHCLATSDHDAELLKKNNPDLPVTVVPNGVDINACQLLDDFPKEKTLLMIGTIGYPPNEDAVLFFCNKILPIIEQRIPDIKLLVIGHAPSRKVAEYDSRHNINILGSVPDVLPYYEKSSIAVVPLRGGGGTRLKILEAMAFGRPVVSTTIGCEGLNVLDGEHLLVADSPSEFADCVIRLLENHSLRNRIIQSARRLVENRYDWEIVCNDLQKIYQRISI